MVPEIPLTLTMRTYRSLISSVSLHNSQVTKDIACLNFAIFDVGPWNDLTPPLAYSVLIYHLWILQVVILNNMIPQPSRNQTPSVYGLSELPDGSYLSSNASLRKRIYKTHLVSAQRLHDLLRLTLDLKSGPLSFARPTITDFFQNITQVNRQNEFLSTNVIISAISFALGRLAFQKNLIFSSNELFKLAKEKMAEKQLEYIEEVGATSQLVNAYLTCCQHLKISPKSTEPILDSFWALLCQNLSPEISKFDLQLIPSHASPQKNAFSFNDIVTALNFAPSASKLSFGLRMSLWRLMDKVRNLLYIDCESKVDISQLKRDCNSWLSLYSKEFVNNGHYWIRNSALAQTVAFCDHLISNLDDEISFADVFGNLSNCVGDEVEVANFKKQLVDFIILNSPLKKFSAQAAQFATSFEISSNNTLFPADAQAIFRDKLEGKSLQSSSTDSLFGDLPELGLKTVNNTILELGRCVRDVSYLMSSDPEVVLKACKDLLMIGTSVETIFRSGGWLDTALPIFLKWSIRDPLIKHRRDAAFIANSSLSYDFLAAVSENINCAPSLLLLFRALEYRRDRMNFEVAKTFLSLSERNQPAADIKQDISFGASGVPFWRRSLLRWIYEMIEEEKTVLVILDAITATSTSRQVPPKDLLLQQCKSILADDFGPERIISDDLLACAACYLLIGEPQFISEYKGRLFVPSLISQLLTLSTEKPNFTKSACSLCSNFLQPWLKSTWDKSLFYFQNASSFSPSIGGPQSVSNMGLLTFTIKLLSLNSFTEGHVVLDRLINCLTTFLKNALKVEPTVDYNPTKAIKKKSFLQEVADLLQIALTCGLESDRNNTNYLMDQAHLQSRIQSNNPRLVISLILQAAATESNYFSQRVSSSLFTPQTLEALIIGCQSTGYLGEALVLCQFEGKIHIPTGLRILEGSVKATSTSSAYDSLEPMTVFLWDLQLLEALCKFQQCNQAFSKKNSFLRCINQLENRCSFSEAAFKRRGSGTTIRIDIRMDDIDYIAEYNMTCLSMLYIHTNFFDFGDYVILWDGDFSHYDNSQCHIMQLINDISHCDGSIVAIIKIFSQLRGAFAFILIQKSSNQIYFGRDKVGQRSLVGNLDLTFMGSLCFPNIDGLVEIPASGIYVASARSSGGFSIEACYFWSVSHRQIWIDHSFNQGIKYDVINYPPKPICGQDNPVNTLKTLLQQAIAKQVGPLSQLSFRLSDVCSCLHAQIGILFSGGLDSTVIAALTDSVIPTDHSIDLINVAFQHLRRNVPSNKKLSKNNDSTSDQLYASPDDAPDRQTALSSFEDLRRLNPNRHWHLILADVSIEELKNARRDRVRALLKPAPESVLNDSLSIAFWFAARGRGRLICSQKICSESQQVEFTSLAKVILTGTGADEQLAGYSRHRKIFERQGAEAVQSELSMEMLRISERNLGRDDRIVSDHGRQVSHPFLDEDVTHYLASLALEEKVDLNLPRGEGEKRLLRKVAASLDLLTASRLPKRAFQFGSRMAKTESLHKVSGADSAPLGVD
nr:integrator complex subunit 8 [Hymenolepis microstoma]